MNSEHYPEISYTGTQTEKPFCIKHTIKNPNFFVVDKVSNEYIANHKNISFVSY